jgi:RNA-directed DNA polymerase
LPPWPERWHKRVVENGEWLRPVVQGYFNYHAVPGNFAALRTFQREVARMWLAALRRRSQRDRHSWERFRPIVDRYLPPPRFCIYQGVASTLCTRGKSRMR